jgi:hypothetical protein
MQQMEFMEFKEALEFVMMGKIAESTHPEWNFRLRMIEKDGIKKVYPCYLGIEINEIVCPALTLDKFEIKRFSKFRYKIIEIPPEIKKDTKQKILECINRIQENFKSLNKAFSEIE